MNIEMEEEKSMSELITIGVGIFLIAFYLGVKWANKVSSKYYGIFYYNLHKYLENRKGQILPEIDFDYFTKIVSGEEK